MKGNNYPSLFKRVALLSKEMSKEIQNIVTTEKNRPEVSSIWFLWFEVIVCLKKNHKLNFLSTRTLNNEKKSPQLKMVIKILYISFIHGIF